MMPVLRLAPLLVLALGLCASGLEVTPVQKVIQLLEEMKATSQKEKRDEAVQYSAFQQFCTDKQASTKREIEKANEKIELLTSEIAKLKAEIAELVKAIDELTRQVAKDEAEIEATKEQRAKDHAEYLEEHEDLSESVDALERAIVVLKKQSGNVAQALLQLSASPKMPEGAKRTIAAFLEMSAPVSSPMSFLQQGQDPEATYTAPEANAYEFQSGGIVDLLEKLKKEFREKKTECEKEEMNSKHAADMVMQDLTDSVENAKADIASKSTDLQNKKERVAEATSELQLTTKDRDEDVKYLSDLEAECEQKGLSFTEKQELRAQEIAAIEKAIEILSSDAVSGNAEKHLPASLAQAATSLVQLGAQKPSSRPSDFAIRKQLIDFLTSQSQKLNNKRLGLLAQKAQDDPFKKVKKMIEELIVKLLAEANAEAEQKGFCDKELGTNKITRNKLNADIDELAANIDEANANIARLSEDIASLTKEVADLDQAMAEATKLREEEKAKNAATIKDAVEAQEAVAAARAVLEDFYKKAGEATAFVQLSAKYIPVAKFSAVTKHVKLGSEEWEALANPNFKGTVDKGHKEGMQTFGDKFTGHQDEAGGVLAMLEVITSDFANLESETKTNEQEAQAAYDDFMADASKTKAVKSKNIEMFTADKAKTEQKLSEDTTDLKANQDELLAADRYYEKLKPTCVDVGFTYEDRVKAREEELQSLREAMKILQGADFGA